MDLPMNLRVVLQKDKDLLMTLARRFGWLIVEE